MHDGGIIKGIVWRAGSDAPDAGRWRANLPRPAVQRVAFYKTPQAAAVENYDERARYAARKAAK